MQRSSLQLLFIFIAHCERQESTTFWSEIYGLATGVKIREVDLDVFVFTYEKLLCLQNMEAGEEVRWFGAC